MKLLLDTHWLLWAAQGRNHVPPGARASMSEVGNELFFSAASFWEIAIKRGLGCEDFIVDPHLPRRGLLDNAHHELPILGGNMAAVDGLPAIHEAPFDRWLLPQASVEGMILLTADALVLQYSGPIQSAHAGRNS